MIRTWCCVSNGKDTWLLEWGRRRGGRGMRLFMIVITSNGLCGEFAFPMLVTLGSVFRILISRMGDAFPNCHNKFVPLVFDS